MNEKEGKQQVLEAEAVYVAMSSNFRVSRNTRAAWYLENLCVPLCLPTHSNSEDASCTKTTSDGKELNLVAVKLKHQTAVAAPSTYQQCILTRDTKVFFVAQQCRFSIVVDFSESAFSVDPRCLRPRTSCIREALKQLLLDFSRPLKLPGVTLSATIYITIIVFTHAQTTVLVQGESLNAGTVSEIVASCNKKLLDIEERLMRAKAFQTERNSSSAPMQANWVYDDATAAFAATETPQLSNISASGPRGSVVAGSRSACTLCPVEDDFTAMIRHGVLALHLLPDSTSVAAANHSGVIIVSDCDFSTPSSLQLNDILRTMRNTSITCSFVCVNSNDGGGMEDSQASPCKRKQNDTPIGAFNSSTSHSFGRLSCAHVARFIASATFGTFFKVSHNHEARSLPTCVLNGKLSGSASNGDLATRSDVDGASLQHALLTWSFNKCGVAFDTVWLCPEWQLASRFSANFRLLRMVIEEAREIADVPFLSLMSVRLREGFTIHGVNVACHHHSPARDIAHAEADNQTQVDSSGSKQISVRFLLPCRPNVFIEYTITSEWKCDDGFHASTSDETETETIADAPATRMSQSGCDLSGAASKLSHSQSTRRALAVIADYEFLHDYDAIMHAESHGRSHNSVTCARCASPLSREREAALRRFVENCDAILATDAFLKHLHGFDANAALRIVPPNVRAGVPLLAAASTSQSASGADFREFFDFWRVIDNVSHIEAIASAWHRWMHTQRIHFILRHDDTIDCDALLNLSGSAPGGVMSKPKRDVQIARRSGPNSGSGSKLDSSCRNALYCLNALLTAESSFVISENCSYVRFIAYYFTTDARTGAGTVQIDYDCNDGTNFDSPDNECDFDADSDGLAASGSTYSHTERTRSRRAVTFYLIRVDMQYAPRVCVRLAFLGGTPGAVRHKVLRSLRDQLRIANFASLLDRDMRPRASSLSVSAAKRRGVQLHALATDRSRTANAQIINGRPITKESPEIGSASTQFGPAGLGACFMLFVKPIDRIIVVYDESRLRNCVSLTHSQFVGLLERSMAHTHATHTDASAGTSTDSVPDEEQTRQLYASTCVDAFSLRTLFRHLHHRRFVFRENVADTPGLSGAFDKALTHVTGLLLRKRVDEDFVFSYATDSYVNLIREFEMDVQNGSPCGPSYRVGDVTAIVQCVMLIVAEPTSSTTGGAQYADSAMGRSAFAPVQKARPFVTSGHAQQQSQSQRQRQNLIVEFWVEPQVGVVVDRVSKFRNKTVFDIVDDLLCSDDETVQTFYTFEYIRQVASDRLGASLFDGGVPRSHSPFAMAHSADRRADYRVRDDVFNGISVPLAPRIELLLRRSVLVTLDCFAALQLADRLCDETRYGAKQIDTWRAAVDSCNDRLLQRLSDSLIYRRFAPIMPETCEINDSITELVLRRRGINVRVSSSQQKLNVNWNCLVRYRNESITIVLFAAAWKDVTRLRELIAEHSQSTDSQSQSQSQTQCIPVFAFVCTVDYLKRHFLSVNTAADASNHVPSSLKVAYIDDKLLNELGRALLDPIPASTLSTAPGSSPSRFVTPQPSQALAQAQSQPPSSPQRRTEPIVHGLRRNFDELLDCYNAAFVRCLYEGTCTQLNMAAEGSPVHPNAHAHTHGHSEGVALFARSNFDYALREAGCDETTPIEIDVTEFVLLQCEHILKSAKSAILDRLITRKLDSLGTEEREQPAAAASGLSPPAGNARRPRRRYAITESEDPKLILDLHRFRAEFEEHMHTAVCNAVKSKFGAILERYFKPIPELAGSFIYLSPVVLGVGANAGAIQSTMPPSQSQVQDQRPSVARQLGNILRRRDTGGEQAPVHGVHMRHTSSEVPARGSVSGMSGTRSVGCSRPHTPFPRITDEVAPENVDEVHLQRTGSADSLEGVFGGSQVVRSSEVTQQVLAARNSISTTTRTRPLSSYANVPMRDWSVAGPELLSGATTPCGQSMSALATENPFPLFLSLLITVRYLSEADRNRNVYSDDFSTLPTCFDETCKLLFKLLFADPVDGEDSEESVPFDLERLVQQLNGELDLRSLQITVDLICLSAKLDDYNVPANTTSRSKTRSACVDMDDVDGDEHEDTAVFKTPTTSTSDGRDQTEMEPGSGGSRTPANSSGGQRQRHVSGAHRFRPASSSNSFDLRPSSSDLRLSSSDEAEPGVFFDYDPDESANLDNVTRNLSADQRSDLRQLINEVKWFIQSHCVLSAMRFYLSPQTQSNLVAYVAHHICSSFPLIFEALEMTLAEKGFAVNQRNRLPLAIREYGLYYRELLLDFDASGPLVSHGSLNPGELRKRYVEEFQRCSKPAALGYFVPVNDYYVLSTSSNSLVPPEDHWLLVRILDQSHAPAASAIRVAVYYASLVQVASSRSLRSVAERPVLPSVISETKIVVRKVARTVNQRMLLRQLYASRSCNPVLVAPPDDNAVVASSSATATATTVTTSAGISSQRASSGITRSASASTLNDAAKSGRTTPATGNSQLVSSIVQRVTPSTQRVEFEFESDYDEFEDYDDGLSSGSAENELIEAEVADRGSLSTASVGAGVSTYTRIEAGTAVINSSNMMVSGVANERQTPRPMSTIPGANASVSSAMAHLHGLSVTFGLGEPKPMRKYRDGYFQCEVLKTSTFPINHRLVQHYMQAQQVAKDKERERERAADALPSAGSILCNSNYRECYQFFNSAAVNNYPGMYVFNDQEEICYALFSVKREMSKPIATADSQVAPGLAQSQNLSASASVSASLSTGSQLVKSGSAATAAFATYLEMTLHGLKQPSAPLVKFLEKTIKERLDSEALELLAKWVLRMCRLSAEDFLFIQGGSDSFAPEYEFFCELPAMVDEHLFAFLFYFKQNLLVHFKQPKVAELAALRELDYLDESCSSGEFLFYAHETRYGHGHGVAFVHIRLVDARKQPRELLFNAPDLPRLDDVIDKYALDDYIKCINDIRPVDKLSQQVHPSPSASISRQRDTEAGSESETDTLISSVEADVDYESEVRGRRGERPRTLSGLQSMSGRGARKAFVLGLGTGSYLHIRIWARCNDETLLRSFFESHVRTAVQLALCDLLVEYKLLTISLCTTPSGELPSTQCSSVAQTPGYAKTAPSVTSILPNASSIMSPLATSTETYSFPATATAEPTATPTNTTSGQQPVAAPPSGGISLPAASAFRRGDAGLLHCAYSSLFAELVEKACSLSTQLPAFSLPSASAPAAAGTASNVGSTYHCEQFELASRVSAELLLVQYLRSINEDGIRVQPKIFAYDPGLRAYTPTSVSTLHSAANSPFAVRGEPGRYVLVLRTLEVMNRIVACSSVTNTETGAVVGVGMTQTPTPKTGMNSAISSRLVPLEIGAQMQDRPNFADVEYSCDLSAPGCFVPRQTLHLLVIANRVITAYFYNWTNEKDKLCASLRKHVETLNVRSCLLKNIVLQKLGYAMNSTTLAHPKLMQSAEWQAIALKPGTNVTFDGENTEQLKRQLGPTVGNAPVDPRQVFEKRERNVASTVNLRTSLRDMPTSSSASIASSSTSTAQRLPFCSVYKHVSAAWRVPRLHNFVIPRADRTNATESASTTPVLPAMSTPAPLSDALAVYFKQLNETRSLIVRRLDHQRHVVSHVLTSLPSGSSTASNAPSNRLTASSNDLGCRQGQVQESVLTVLRRFARPYEVVHLPTLFAQQPFTSVTGTPPAAGFSAVVDTNAARTNEALLRQLAHQVAAHWDADASDRRDPDTVTELQVTQSIQSSGQKEKSVKLSSSQLASEQTSRRLRAPSKCIVLQRLSAPGYATTLVRAEGHLLLVQINADSNEAVVTITFYLIESLPAAKSGSNMMRGRRSRKTSLSTEAVPTKASALSDTIRSIPLALTESISHASLAIPNTPDLTVPPVAMPVAAAVATLRSTLLACSADRLRRLFVVQYEFYVRLCFENLEATSVSVAFRPPSPSPASTATAAAAIAPSSGVTTPVPVPMSPASPSVSGQNVLSMVRDFTKYFRTSTVSSYEHLLPCVGVSSCVHLDAPIDKDELFSSYPSSSRKLDSKLSNNYDFFVNLLKYMRKYGAAYNCFVIEANTDANEPEWRRAIAQTHHGVSILLLLSPNGTGAQAKATFRFCIVHSVSNESKSKPRPKPNREPLTCSSIMFSATQKQSIMCQFCTQYATLIYSNRMMLVDALCSANADYRLKTLWHSLIASSSPGGARNGSGVAMPVEQFEELLDKSRRIDLADCDMRLSSLLVSCSEHTQSIERELSKSYPNQIRRFSSPPSHSYIALLPAGLQSAAPAAVVSSSSNSSNDGGGESIATGVTDCFLLLSFRQHAVCKLELVSKNERILEVATLAKLRRYRHSNVLHLADDLVKRLSYIVWWKNCAVLWNDSTH